MNVIDTLNPLFKNNKIGMFHTLIFHGLPAQNLKMRTWMGVDTDRQRVENAFSDFKGKVVALCKFSLAIANDNHYHYYSFMRSRVVPSTVLPTPGLNPARRINTLKSKRRTVYDIYD